jgi:hypothetical protein
MPRNELGRALIGQQETIDGSGKIVNNRDCTPNHRPDPIDLRICFRPGSSTDEPFLLLLRKLPMTEYLGKAGVPTDDDTHCERIRANFDDARIIRAGDEDVGLIKLSRDVSEWHVHQFQILPNYQGRGVGEAVFPACQYEMRHLPWTN